MSGNFFLSERQRTPKYFMRPTFPQNFLDLDLIECYKTWFMGMMIGVRPYMHLLHKQNMIKGRNYTKRNYSLHPKYPNAYFVAAYWDSGTTPVHNITCHNGEPYHKTDYNKTGMNSFYSGVDFRKEKAKSIIFNRDVNRIQLSRIIKSFFTFSSVENVMISKQDNVGDEYWGNISVSYVPFLDPNYPKPDYDFAIFWDIKEALKYKHKSTNSYKILFFDERINKDLHEAPKVEYFYSFSNYSKYNEILNDTSIEWYDEKKVQSYAINQSIFIEVLSDINIIYPQEKHYKKFKLLGKTGSLKSVNIYTIFDARSYYDDLKKLNPQLKIVEIYLKYSFSYKYKVGYDEELITVTKTITQPLIEINAWLESVKTKAINNNPYSKPLCIVNFDTICYDEPYILVKMFNDLNVGQACITPLYQRSSNNPYGRMDRWFCLWQEFHKIEVRDHKEKSIGGIILGAVMIIAAAVLTVVTFGTATPATSQLFIAGAVVANAGMAISGMGAIGGNEKVMGIGSVVGAVGAVVGGVSSLTSSITNSATATTTSTFSSTITTLSNVAEVASGAFTLFNSLTADTPDMLSDDENAESEDEYSNGSSEEEIEKELDKSLFKWYDFETMDLLEIKQELSVNFIKI